MFPPKRRKFLHMKVFDRPLVVVVVIVFCNFSVSIWQFSTIMSHKKLQFSKYKAKENVFSGSIGFLLRTTSLRNCFLRFFSLTNCISTTLKMNKINFFFFHLNKIFFYGQIHREDHCFIGTSVDVTYGVTLPVHFQWKKGFLIGRRIHFFFFLFK